VGRPASALLTGRVAPGGMPSGMTCLPLHRVPCRLNRLPQQCWLVGVRPPSRWPVRAIARAAGRAGGPAGQRCGHRTNNQVARPWAAGCQGAGDDRPVRGASGLPAASPAVVYQRVGDQGLGRVDPSCLLRGEWLAFRSVG
jgi:hypothetical protein